MIRRHRQDRQVIPVDFRPHAVIATKRKVYALGPDAVGQPLEEVFGTAMPLSLLSARGYMTGDGLLIGHPEPSEPAVS